MNRVQLVMEALLDVKASFNQQQINVIYLFTAIKSAI